MILCFDFDGVIADSFTAVLAMSHTVEKQFSSKTRFSSEEDFKTIKNLVWFDLGKSIGLTDETAKEYSTEVFKAFKKLDSTKIKIFPGIIEVIKELSKKHLLVIITSSQTDYVTSILKREDIYDCFIKIYDGTDGASKSVKIDRAINHLGVERDTVFMIGDSQTDILEGKEAKVKTVAVNWGWQTRELLLGCNPDFVVESPRELLQILS